MEADALALSASLSAVSETAYSVHLDLSRIARVLIDYSQEVEVISNDTLGLSNALDALVEAIEASPNISQRAYSLAKQLLSLSQTIIEQSKDISKHLSPLLHRESLYVTEWSCRAKWMFYKSAYKCHGFNLACFKQTLNLLASILRLHEVTNERIHSRTLSKISEMKPIVDREALQLRNYLVDPSTTESLFQSRLLTDRRQQRERAYRAALDAGPNILDVAKGIYKVEKLSARLKTELQLFQIDVEATARDRGFNNASSANRHSNNFALLSALENVSTFAADAVEEDRRLGSSHISPHPDEPAPPYSEIDDSSSFQRSSFQSSSSGDTNDQNFPQPPSNATTGSSQSAFLHPEDSRNRETAIPERSWEDSPLHVAISYSTLSESIDTASNRFASTDTLIPRDQPAAPVELDTERSANSGLPIAAAHQRSSHIGIPRRSSEILPPGTAVSIVEPDPSLEIDRSDEQSPRTRTSGSNSSAQPSMSELEWQEFIQKATILGDDFTGEILKFQDATGRIHPLPFDRCSASFNNLVAAVRSRFFVILKNPQSLMKIENAFKAAHNDVYFYKADYRELKGEPGREFDISPVRWPMEARPDMVVCVKFTSGRLDSQFGLQRWRDMYPNEVPKVKGGKLAKFFSWS